MMTPQEVSQHAFNKASFGGYNMAQVDEFLDALTADYAVLYKENAVLKSKMKVLVEKVEEYRATEDAMRMTLLSAQKMANAMVAEAEEKKNAALQDAESSAKQRVAELQQEIANEEYRLTAAKNATTAYLAGLRDLFDHERDYLAHLSELAAPGPKPPDPVETAATEIEDSMHKLLQEAPVPQAEEPESDPEDTKELEVGEVLAAQASIAGEARPSVFQPAGPAGVEAPGLKQDDPDRTRAIDFTNLQFGRDYEIK